MNVSSRRLIIAILAGVAGTAFADPVLDVNSASLTSYLPGAASSGQDLIPLHTQRGTGIDGSENAGSGFGWSLGASPVAESWNGNGRMMGVHLDTGSPSLMEVDISLPSAGPRWTVGRTYNAVQTTTGALGGTHRDGDGFQGKNWFQTSQPELKYYDGGTGGVGSGDVVYILYGADRYLEFKWASTSVNTGGVRKDEFRGTNGAAGVIQLVKDTNGSPTSPDLWTYTDQVGTKTVFFGGDALSSGAEWQLWKITDEAGNAVYVGDASSATTAISVGYSGRRIQKAYDQAGRRYTYSYASLGGGTRLTQVLAETKTGGTWASPTGTATVGQVDYAYYTSADSGQELNADFYGCLKMVTVTTPLSDTSLSLAQKKYYRYYGGTYNGSTNPGNPGQLALVLGYEGARKYDWDQDGNLDDDFRTATTANLKSYSELYYTYYAHASGNTDRNSKVASVFANGQCGCSGGANGVYAFDYETNSGYSDTSGYEKFDRDPGAGTDYVALWARRTVVTEPESRWTTQYFDETAQPLSRVMTTAAPTGTPTNVWATQVIRNDKGQLIEIYSPANITSYTHTNGSVSYTASGSTGLVTRFARRAASDDMDGLLESDSWQQGTSGELSKINQRDYSSFSQTVGSATLKRPVISQQDKYEQVKPTGSSQPSPVSTTIANVSTGSGLLAEQARTTTLPTPTTGNNGWNNASVMLTHVSTDRVHSFTRSPDSPPIIGYRRIDAATGLWVMSIQDVDTAHADLTGVTIPSSPSSFASGGTEFHYKTTWTYDAQGRMSTTTDPDGVVSMQYVTKLGDGRTVSLSVPRVVAGSPTTYYSPVMYTVTSQAGGVEFQATVAFSGGSTTTSINSWIDETDSDPITALDVGTITRLSTNLYTSDGTRVTESRQYSVVPSSGAGSSGTNYDATTFAYSDSGRRWRTKYATGTVRRTVYDGLGRSSESWIGTNDSNWSSYGGDSSGTDTMTKTDTVEYDGGNPKGNSFVTSRTVDPDGLWVNNGTTGNPDDRRITTYTYDARGRVLLTTNPQAPHVLTAYDNLGRVTATATYSSTASITAGTTNPIGSGTNDKANRLNASTTAYDQMGRVYNQEILKVALSTGAASKGIETNTWYDASSRVIKVHGASHTKTAYDRIGRAIRVYTVGKTDDADYDDATDVVGDLVLEERQTIYDATSGLVLFDVALQRVHDNGTTGVLDGNTDGDLATLTCSTANDNNVNPNKVRVNVNATWYDAMRRPTDTCSYGTNGSGNGTTFTRPGSAPSRSDSELVSTTAYDADGSVLSTTDPRGLVTRMEYDAAGRTTKVIKNYVDGTAGGGTNADEDQTIQYAYSKGLQSTYTAVVPGGTNQVTKYIYGSTKGTSAGQSAIATGNLLRATVYPDSSNTGTTLANIDSDSSDVVSMAYNALGQGIYRKDQAANVIQTDYDSAGRSTYRRATTVGGSFNSDVLRIGTSYTSKGQVDAVTQYSNATVGSGSVVDEVKYVYDDWGNISNFRQDRDSAVSSSGGTNGYQEAAYTWDSSVHLATGGLQAVRCTGITLPGSFGVALTFGTTNGIDDCVNRVVEVKVSSTTVAEYEYLGMGTLVSTEYKEPSAVSALYSSSGASYDRLDRFNRVTSSHWKKIGGRTFYQVDLGYDRDSNILTAEDQVHAGYDASYTMDGLNRLIVADEGTLSGGSITGRTRKEAWTLSQVGTWTGFTSDLNGDGSFSSQGFTATAEKSESRTSNAVNEITARTINGTTKNPVYNANGQQTDDGVNYTYEWDAWGRMTKVSTRGGSPQTVVQYKYNGLNYQIGRHADLDADGDVDNTDKWEWSIYDPRWRRVAIFMVAGGSAFTGSADTSPKEQYVHHAAGVLGRGSYVDSVVFRNRDQTNGNNGSADGTLENREYYAQNWRADVSVTMTSAGRILEWMKYSAYGVAQRIPLGDFNRDGQVDFFDDGDFATEYGGLTAAADINYDGATNGTDNSQWTATFAEQGATPRGEVSQSTGVPAINRLGYAGYFFEPSTQQYLVRNREFDPLVGVWDERDPIGYRDGSSLYPYVSSQPIIKYDPMGLASVRSTGCCGAISGNVPTLSVAGAVDVLDALCKFNYETSLLLCRISLNRQACEDGAHTSYMLCLAASHLYQDSGIVTSCLLTPSPGLNNTQCSWYPRIWRHLGVDMGCVCRCMPNWPWSQAMRHCLQCAMSKGATPTNAHAVCLALVSAISPPTTYETGMMAACISQCSRPNDPTERYPLPGTPLPPWPPAGY